MEINDIVQAVKNRLTKDFERDFNFLMREMEHFRFLGLFEIADALMKLFEEELGDKGKAKLQELVKNEITKRKDSYITAIQLINEKKYQEAQERLVQLIDTFEKGLFNYRGVKVVNFRNPFEHIFYQYRITKNQEKFVKAEEPITSFYFYLSVIMFALQDYEACVNMAQKALDYDVLNIEALLLKAEATYYLGDTEFYTAYLVEALQHAYTRHNIAHAYLLLSKYYLENEKYEVACACAKLAEEFSEDIKKEEVINIFLKAKTKISSNIKIEQLATIREILKKEGIPAGISSQVLGTIEFFIEDSKKQGVNNMTTYLKKLAYDLTLNPKFLN